MRAARTVRSLKHINKSCVNAPHIVQSAYEFAIMSTDTRTPPTAHNDKRDAHVFGDVIRFAVLALIIVLPIRLFIAQPFLVSGASMEPTFENGDYLVVDQISYELGTPKRGDVVIFRFPKDPSRFFIKRIIGLPNETVRIENNRVIIENKAQPNGFTLLEPYLQDGTVTYGALSATLGPDEYFVLGDNREHSSDSRVWGPVPARLIAGRALVRLYPPADIGILPGQHNAAPR